MNDSNLITFCKLNKTSIKEILDIDKLEKISSSNKSLIKLMEQLVNFLNLNEEKQQTLIEENKLLKEQNYQLENQIQNMKTKIIFLEKTAAVFSSEELEEDDITFDNLCKELRENYKYLDKYIKRYLEHEFEIISPESLIINGSLYLEKLWDYALMCRKKSRFITFEDVKHIVYLLFHFKKEVFDVEWQEVKIGDKFDETKFLMDDESENKLGIIEEVILKGYLKDGELIKRSLVIVK